MSSMYKFHYSVMKEECLSYLTHDGELTSGIFADLTFGGGGHSVALVKRSKDYKLYATDQDPEALKNGYDLLKREGVIDQVKLLDMNFVQFADYAQQENVPLLDGILLDLGVSSHHFDAPERGFSFRFDAPLDMRMDVDNGSIPTAAELLATWEEEELANVLWKYAQERFSRQIARNIVELRKETSIVTTKQLENIVFHSYPRKMRYGKTHPATKTFQALRIAVNHELEVLEQTLVDLPKLLAPNGRLVIITFHSLEDRIVKHSYNYLAKEKKIGKILTKKPITASKRELEENRRSRSAKLRIFEKY